MAFIRIAHRFRVHHFHAANAHRAQLEPANVQNIERDLMAFPDFAQHIFDRRLRVRENQRRRARSANSHLVFFRAVLAALLALDNESGKLVAVDFREHNEDVGESAVGNEHLLAVENVVGTVVTQFRGRFRGHGI